MVSAALDETTSRAKDSPVLVRGLSQLQFGLLVVCVASQSMTVLITWPLWQVRESPALMPLFGTLPQIPFGLLMLGSLALVLLTPKMGTIAHILVLFASFLFDQFRTQPQFIANAILMAAVVDARVLILSRWFLASMWGWAGLHKLLSPDWHSWVSWSLTSRLGWDPEWTSQPFCWIVAFSEFTLGMLAIFRPRWALALCAPMHVGIVIFLSPIGIAWNYSVIPWNLATAVVGSWIMWKSKDAWPQFRWEWPLAAMLLVYPIGFYAGWVDHGIASVLYSNHVPNGLITTQSGSAKIRGWGELCVPFPYERRLLRLYFERSAPVGAKLHIDDPRGRLEDQYFVKTGENASRSITRAEFVDRNVGTVIGMEFDDRRAKHILARSGVTLMQRDANSPVFAVEFPPDVYLPELLSLLGELPNIEQINLRGCKVSDQQLRNLPQLPKLQGIGLADTQVTNKALQSLQSFPELRFVEFEGSKMTFTAVQAFESRKANSSPQAKP